MTCAICGAPEKKPGVFNCAFACPHRNEDFQGLLAVVADWFTIAPRYRTKELLLKTVKRENLLLTQENARLWERVKELQNDVEVWKGHTKEGGNIIDGLLAKLEKK